MRDQARRDEETLRIFSAVVLFVLVVGVGGGVLAFARSAVGLPDGVASALLAAVLAVAAGLAVASIRGRSRSLE